MGNNIFIGMKTYKIKLEDKAALVNALKSISIGVDSYNIVDDLNKGYFEITFTNPQDEQTAKDVLRTHSGINQLKELLRKIVREELKSNDLRIDQIYYYKGNKLKYLKSEKGYYYFNTFKNGKVNDVTRLEKEDLINLSSK